MMIASSADTVLALDAMRLLSLPVTQSPQDQWINSTFNIAWCRDDGVIAARNSSLQERRMSGLKRAAAIFSV